MNLLTTGKLKYHNVELNKLLTYTIPPAYHHFPRDTVSQIVRLILEYWESKYGIFSIPNMKVLRSIQWRWMHPTGNFTTRLARLLKEQWDFNIPSSLLSDIGNIAQKDTVLNGEVYFDLTERLQWKAGDFGDGGSCFWSGRKDIREAMEKEGNFYALRIFKKIITKPDHFDLAEYDDQFGRIGWMTSQKPGTKFYDHYIGTGRSWLYETRVAIKTSKGIEEHPAIFMFNSYGVTIASQSLILTSFLQRDRGICALKNKGKLHGGLYFNGAGYIISAPLATKTIKYWDFNLTDPYAEDFVRMATMQQDLDARRTRIKNTIQPQTLKQRQALRKQEKNQYKSTIIHRDMDQGKYHQRYINYTTQNKNKNMVSNLKSTIEYHYKSKVEFAEIVKKLDSLKPILKKLDNDPIKVINYHIKNHLL